MNLDYEIYPLRYVPTNMLVSYLESLQEKDLLRHRFSERKSITVDEALKVLSCTLDHSHAAVRTDTMTIAGEFTISEHFGKCGLIHFSMSPKNTIRETIFIASDVTDKVLTKWETTGKPGDPYVTSLVGLTPALNRRACLFINKVGFKRITVLPDATRYEGEVCDALLTIKKREEVKHGKQWRKRREQRS